MKIEDLEAFAAVVRSQSISGAAEAMGLTQPSITRRVQSLEEALGVELLDRSVKPPRPNAMGKRVHERCRAVLHEIDNLRELVALDARPGGTLRLALTQGLGDLVLPAALARLREHWPELTVQVATAWAAQVLDRLEHGELDGAAVLLPSGQGLPKGLHGAVAGTLRVVVVAARGTWTRPRARLADIAKLGWVLNPDGCGFRAGLQRALAAIGEPLDVRLETFGRELQLQLVADGLGLGLVPEPLVAASAWRSRLEVIAVSDFQPSVDLWVLHARLLGQLEGPVAAFAQSVAGALGLTLPPAAGRRARR